MHHHGLPLVLVFKLLLNSRSYFFLPHTVSSQCAEAEKKLQLENENLRKEVQQLKKDLALAEIHNGGTKVEMTFLIRRLPHLHEGADAAEWLVSMNSTMTKEPFISAEIS